MSPELYAELEAIFGDRVSTELGPRLARARDLWSRGLIAVEAGEAPTQIAEAVVWPRDAQEVSELLRWAGRRRVALVPRGAGSGVCGAAVPWKGGVIVDCASLDRIVEIDAEAGSVTVEAGVIGLALEEALNARGLTLGHFPSSIMCSTVGGWIATRSAGQLSTRYGKIEDLLLGLELVDGVGERIVLDAARDRGLCELVLGAEGKFGIVTQARLVVRPMARASRYQAFRFACVEDGVAAIRDILQTGARPAVVRLYDPIDTLIHRSERDHRDESDERLNDSSEYIAKLRPRTAIARSLKDRAMTALLSRPRIARAALFAAARARRFGCLLVVGGEGEKELVAAEAQIVSESCLRAGGVDLGDELARRWLSKRYAVSRQLPRMFEAGAIVDTMEIAAPWSRLIAAYDAVRARLADQALVFAHFSHAYPDGCSIYFSFVAATRDGSDPRAKERLYDKLWRDALSSAMDAGATVSHHHGIGALKAEALDAEVHDARAVLARIKVGFDPSGLLAPGTWA